MEIAYLQLHRTVTILCSLGMVPFLKNGEYAPCDYDNNKHHVT